VCVAAVDGDLCCTSHPHHSTPHLGAVLPCIGEFSQCGDLLTLLRPCRWRWIRRGCRSCRLGRPLCRRPLPLSLHSSLNEQSAPPTAKCAKCSGCAPSTRRLYALPFCPIPLTSTPVRKKVEMLQGCEPSAYPLKPTHRLEQHSETRRRQGMADAEACLSVVAARVPGLRAILVTDRDGITVMRHPKEDEMEQRSSSNIEAAFSIAADQVSAIGKYRFAQRARITAALPHSLQGSFLSYAKGRRKCVFVRLLLPKSGGGGNPMWKMGACWVDRIVWAQMNLVKEGHALHHFTSASLLGRDVRSFYSPRA